jgi:hypothetical protein
MAPLLFVNFFDEDSSQRSTNQAHAAGCETSGVRVALPGVADSLAQRSKMENFALIMVFRY